MWVFGGEFVSPSQNQFYHYKDLWTFSLTEHKWTSVRGPGGPSARSGHRMVLFRKLLLVFGGFHDNNNPVPSAFLHYMKKNIPDAANHKIYFDHGTTGLDSMYTVHQLNANDTMRDGGYIDDQNLKTKVFVGHDHNETYWAQRLDEVFIFLMAR